MLPNSCKLTIIKTIVALADEAMKQTIDPNSPSEGHYIFPVKGCMFFGVPHKGADIADKASGFLSVLGNIFNVNRNNIRDLRPKSQRFANISSQFRSVQSEHNIPVISFFETVKYNHTVGIVSWMSTFCWRSAIGRSRADWRRSFWCEVLLQCCWLS